MPTDIDWNVFKANTLRLLVSDLGGRGPILNNREAMLEFLNVYKDDSLDAALKVVDRYRPPPSSPSRTKTASSSTNDTLSPSTPRKRNTADASIIASTAGIQTRSSGELFSKRKRTMSERASLSAQQAADKVASASARRTRKTSTPKKPLSSSNSGKVKSKFEGVFVPNAKHRSKEEKSNDASGDDEDAEGDEDPSMPGQDDAVADGSEENVTAGLTSTKSTSDKMDVDIPEAQMDVDLAIDSALFDEVDAEADVEVEQSKDLQTNTVDHHSETTSNSTVGEGIVLGGITVLPLKRGVGDLNSVD